LGNCIKGSRIRVEVGIRIGLSHGVLIVGWIGEIVYPLTVKR
jgi:hypothetical protein